MPYRRTRGKGKTVVVLGVLLLGLAGCTPDLVTLAETMNARHISSCLEMSGSYLGMAAHIITATGEATLDQCAQWR